MDGDFQIERETIELERRLRDLPTRRRWGRPYAAISADIDRWPIRNVGWARALAEALGVDENRTIGELLVHCDKRNRAVGRVGFLREDLLRREGAVPTEATVHVDIASQYAMLGKLIREGLDKRGLNGEVLQAVHDAIVEAVTRMQEGTDAADADGADRLDDRG